MMKEEFETNIGHEVEPWIFELIEDVYMNSDLFEKQSDVYAFYNTFSIRGFIVLKKDQDAKRDLEKIEKDMKEISTISKRWYY